MQLPRSMPMKFLLSGLGAILLAACATSSPSSKITNPHLYEGPSKSLSEVAVFETTDSQLKAVAGRQATEWPAELYLPPGRHEFSFWDKPVEVLDLKAGHRYARPRVQFLADAQGRPMRLQRQSGADAATRAKLLMAGGSLGMGSPIAYRMVVDRTTRQLVSTASPEFRRFVAADRAAAASALGVPVSALP